jgi:hypothetical protein
MEWIAANVPLCSSNADCERLAQHMLTLGIFHNVYNEAVFQPVKGLYSFSKEGRGMLPLLRQRIVAAEDQLLGQIKAFKQAQSENTSRLFQLDWRISVAERRTHGAEMTLRRSLVAQQLFVIAMLSSALLRFVPLPLLVIEAVYAVSAILLIVSLLESRIVLLQFLNLKVCPASAEEGVDPVVYSHLLL